MVAWAVLAAAQRLPLRHRSQASLVSWMPSPLYDSRRVISTVGEGHGGAQLLACFPPDGWRLHLNGGHIAGGYRSRE